MQAATLDEQLVILGTAVRAARESRGMSQERVARMADVSRAQLAGLERGANVSVKFLLKVAHLLGLADIPLDGRVRITVGQKGVNVPEVLHALDLCDALVEFLRASLLQSVLPGAEQKTLTATPALRDFVARHMSSAEGLSRLTDAILDFSRGAPLTAPPFVGEETRQVKSTRRQRREG